MKLRVLVDNNTYIDQYYVGEPGVSYYIEDGEDKILFDMGYSDIFMKNAAAMNIALHKVNKIVFSHGHDDHTRGLQFFSDKFAMEKIEIIAHPDALKEKVLDHSLIGSPILAAKLQTLCKLRLTKEPVKVTENLVFLGQIPQLNSFEKRHALGFIKDGADFEEDFLLDDSALVYQGRQGLFIITGCSHSGICNMIEYAKTVCGKKQVAGIIGGLHLFDKSAQLDKTIKYFTGQQIKTLYPCHCVSFQAKAEMNKQVEIHEVGVGLQLDIV